jgi:hypothetical protein
MASMPNRRMIHDFDMTLIASLHYMICRILILNIRVKWWHISTFDSSHFLSTQTGKHILCIYPWQLQSNVVLHPMRVTPLVLCSYPRFVGKYFYTAFGLFEVERFHNSVKLKKIQSKTPTPNYQILQPHHTTSWTRRLRNRHTLLSMLHIPQHGHKTQYHRA